MRATIGIVTVGKLKPGEKIWDTRVRGFHARRQKGDAVVYVLHCGAKTSSWPAVIEWRPRRAPRQRSGEQSERGRRIRRAGEL